MSNTINNLSTSNTFLQWLTTTQSLVSRLNILTEGGNTQTFQANTNIDIANNVTIGGNLTVSGNITLDAIGFDDLIVAGSGSFGTTLDVTGNTTLTNATITYGNFTTANVITLVGGANTAVYANISTVNAYAQSAGSYANSAFVKANSAYESQNTTGIYANSAFTAANSAASDGLAFAIALG